MKTFIAIISACVILGTGVYPQEMSAYKPTTLEKLAGFAVDEQLPLESWKVTMKEQVAQTKIDQLKKELLHSDNEIVMTEEVTKHSRKITFKDAQKNPSIFEYIILIIPNEEKYYAEIVYLVEGRGTASITKEEMMYIDDVKSRYFSGNVTIFSCIEVKSSDIIDDVLVYQNFKKAFNITSIDEVIDNELTIRTGYTEQWEQMIPTANGKMNVQYASRTLGEGTNITIGTPIITSEY
ncbi:YwmB family TATA-box binding protein [Halobacillus yeomjeoni]|uniref:YwmB family TATA-box binding protein n=1 Tax=Halobacillus yeomjeoni TaxID=311194 RepID=UPI001CD21ADB|nr:YwmB family TATA-box binding protein [Halobacillus yeomjeoni]MCA0985485.1 YwmB family TATA-box binding protein [Halobacillus yeomjeoni]